MAGTSAPSGSAQSSKDSWRVTNTTALSYCVNGENVEIIRSRGGQQALDVTAAFCTSVSAHRLRTDVASDEAGTSPRENSRNATNVACAAEDASTCCAISTQGLMYQCQQSYSNGSSSIATTETGMIRDDDRGTDDALSCHLAGVSTSDARHHRPWQQEEEEEAAEEEESDGPPVLYERVDDEDVFSFFPGGSLLSCDRDAAGCVSLPAKKRLTTANTPAAAGSLSACHATASGEATCQRPQRPRADSQTTAFYADSPGGTPVGLASRRDGVWECGGSPPWASWGTPSCGSPREEGNPFLALSGGAGGTSHGFVVGSYGAKPRPRPL